MKTFKELVGECIGEASMCWSETPKGVFDSTRAEALMNKIIKHHDRKQELFSQITALQEAMRPLLDEWSELNKQEST